MPSAPLAALRHHVTGAVERGDAVAIAGRPAPASAPPMRRAHYVWLAAVIAELASDVSGDAPLTSALADLALCLGSKLSETNPAFNPALFFAACNVKGLN